MMAEQFDMTKLSEEELMELAGPDFKLEPEAVPMSPSGKPKMPGDHEYIPGQEVGSFKEGFVGQLQSPGIAAARMLGVEGAEDVAKEHGHKMTAARQTPMGSMGSTAANVAIGLGVPYLRATTLPRLIASSGIGGGVEAAQEYGEDGSPLQGFMRGAAGTAVANTALSAGAKLVNAGLKKAGAPGRWSSPSDEYIYEFAKSKGVGIRPGDLPGHSMARGFENIHAGPMGNAGLEQQAAQLEKALFGEGNKLLEGIARTDEVITEANKKLWQPVYQLAQGTAPIPLNATKQAVADVVRTYPQVLEGIGNVQVKDMLTKLATGRRTPALTFEDVRTLQKELGPEIGKFKIRAVNGTVSSQEAASLNRLYGAIHGDITRWGNQAGNEAVFDAYKAANTVYKKEILPFEQNDIVTNWKLGVYDGHNEKLLNDLTRPSMRSQQDRLLWYTSHADHDATGYIEMVRMANRASKALAKGQSEPNIPLGLETLIAPKLAAAKYSGHALSGKTGLTPVFGASPNIGPLSLMSGMSTGAGLSIDNKRPSWSDLELIGD